VEDIDDAGVIKSSDAVASGDCRSGLEAARGRADLDNISLDDDDCKPEVLMIDGTRFPCCNSADRFNDNIPAKAVLDCEVS
jgi:hypothetical protein